MLMLLVLLKLNIIMLAVALLGVPSLKCRGTHLRVDALETPVGFLPFEFLESDHLKREPSHSFLNRFFASFNAFVSHPWASTIKHFTAVIVDVS